MTTPPLSEAYLALKVKETKVEEAQKSYEACILATLTPGTRVLYQQYASPNGRKPKTGVILSVYGWSKQVWIQPDKTKKPIQLPVYAIENILPPKTP